MALAIVLGALFASVVARPRYVGRHRASGLPNFRPQRAMWKEWVRGYPDDTYGDEPLDDIIRNNQRG
jgi:hypothetical protein